MRRRQKYGLSKPRAPKSDLTAFEQEMAESSQTMARFFVRTSKPDKGWPGARACPEVAWVIWLCQQKLQAKLPEVARKLKVSYGYIQYLSMGVVPSEELFISMCYLAGLEAPFMIVLWARITLPREWDDMRQYIGLNLEFHQRAKPPEFMPEFEAVAANQKLIDEAPDTPHEKTYPIGYLDANDRFRKECMGIRLNAKFKKGTLDLERTFYNDRAISPATSAVVPRRHAKGRGLDRRKKTVENDTEVAFEGINLTQGEE